MRKIFPAHNTLFSPFFSAETGGALTMHLTMEKRLEEFLLGKLRFIFLRIMHRTRPAAVVALCLCILIRMLLLNVPAICSFFQQSADDFIKIEVLKSGKTECSEGKVSTDLSPAAMVKDSTESMEETLSKSTKYPLLLIALLAFSRVLAEIATRRLVLSETSGFNRGIRKDLSVTILRI